jgi:hypothetical protein
MGHAANDDWPEGKLIVVPHGWRDDSLWSDIRAEVQDRIGSALRAMYADLLLQPLPPELVKLVHQIDTRLATSRHAG